MMCIASHAHAIIKKTTWREYDLAKIRDYEGRYPVYLTPTMACMVLREGLILPAVQKVWIYLFLGLYQ